MHLLIPFAAPLSDAGRQALQTLRLPALDAALRRLAPTHRDDGDAMSLSPPHERALARALGLAGADGALPWAALHAAAAGIATADLAWGELTPVHWRVGSDQVGLVDPASLSLDEAESRALFDALHPMFEAEGVVLVWHSPLLWLAAHESLRELPTASIDRVIGRSVEHWLPAGEDAQLARRLQLQAQMLLHGHAVNEAREARGELPVNSLWLSGCGVHQAPAAGAEVVLDERLRAPALAEDWAAWAEAWQALDRERLAQASTLTLAGERSAVCLQNTPRGLWSRLRHSMAAPQATGLLQTL